MNRFMVGIFLLVGLGGFGSAALAKAADTNTPAEEGELSLICSHKGAWVYLNGVLMGRTPIEPIGLPAGQHHVKVGKEGYVDFGRMLKIEAGRTRDLRVNLQPINPAADGGLETPGLGLELVPLKKDIDSSRTMSPSKDEEVSLEPLTPRPTKGSSEETSVRDAGIGLEPLLKVEPSLNPTENSSALGGLELSEPVPEAWYEDWRVWAGTGVLLTVGAVVVFVFTRQEPARTSEERPDLDHQLCGSNIPCSSWMVPMGPPSGP